MTLAPRKFSGEKWPRNRAVGDAFESKADAGPIADSGLTAPPLTLLGNPRSDDNEPVTPLTVEGDTEFDAENNVFRVLADARRSLGLGQFATTTSDELRGVLDDETGTGSAVFSDTPTLTTPAVIGRITRNGHWVTPYINAQADHGASGIGGEDQTAPIAAAIQEANATGRELIFPPGYYDAVYFPPITTSGVSLRGHGQNATFIRHTATSGNTLRFTGQFPAIRDLTMWPLAWKTSGHEISFEGTYRGTIEDVLIQYHFNGIQIFGSAQPSIKNTTLLFSHGGKHVIMTGSSSAPCSGLFIDGLSTNNAYPLVTTTYWAWALSTAVTAGQYTYVNGYCWQCVTGGTTAGSGTLTPSMINSYDWSLTNVTHGTAVFRMVCTTSLTGVLMDNYAYSLSLTRSALINGAYGLYQTDTASTGTSYPIWVASDDLQTDHCFFAGVYCHKGLDVNLGTKAWIGSTLAGNGIVIDSSHAGSVKIIGARIAGNAHNGVAILGGADNKIAHCSIVANSIASAGTYNGVSVAGGVGDFDISHNDFGNEIGVGTNFMYSGVLVASGASDRYTIAHNAGRGLSSGLTVADGGAGVDKSVFHNLPLTRNEKAFVVVSGTTHTLVGSTDTIRFSPSGACTVTMLSGAQYEGKVVDFYNVSANAVASASSNIGPLAGGAAGTGILAGTAGKYARLKYNSGDNIWYIIGAN